MGLLSIFQRNKQTSAQPGKPGRGGKSPARQAPLATTQNPADIAEAMREERARARTRLMGATVLLLIGVIGFPLLFETQPRPIPVDLPIEIPARNAPGVVDGSSHAAVRSVATAATAGRAAQLASGPAPESVSYDARPAALPASGPASVPTPQRSAFASLAAALTSSPARASDVAASTSAAMSSSAVAQTKPVKPTAASTSTAAAASRPSPVPHAVTPPPTPVAAPSRPSPAAILADTSPPKASDAAANGARFVVQVGAFLDEAKVRETRSKVEKLGMKTYTQPVDTPTGKRIRVRVGPYATKADAEKIAARIKGDGLQAVVLAL